MIAMNNRHLLFFFNK